LKDLNIESKVVKGKEIIDNKLSSLKEKNETFAKTVDYISDNTTNLRKSLNFISKPIKKSAPILKSSVTLAT
jgi:hypothetical protein